MADYKSMYLKLFNATTDAIETLQKAAQEAEETYISAEEEPLVLFPASDDGKGEKATSG